MGMALTDMTKRALKAEAKQAALTTENQLLNKKAKKKKASDWNAEADRYLAQRDELTVELKEQLALLDVIRAAHLQIIDGLKAELATARRELRDNDVRGMNSVEAAVRSPSILDYMNHWEGRCLKAEAKLAALGKGGSDE
jgi:hypothetical protein